MKGCQTFDELQSLGAEKIHERTHISRDKIEQVLTKSYGEINKIQFMGFLSILEREYGLDLSDIKQEYLDYQEEHKSALPPKQSVILQPSSRSKQKWMVAGLVLIIVLTVSGYFAQVNMANIPKEGVIELSSSAVEVVDEPKDSNVTQSLDVNATSDINVTVEANTTKPLTDQNITGLQKLQTIRAADGLEIRPAYKIWAGMIDLDNHEKHQMITKNPIKIDTSKNWLIALGHGRIEIVSSSGSEVVRENGTTWFVYENGTLKRLTKQEFVERNGGNNW